MLKIKYIKIHYTPLKLNLPHLKIEQTYTYFFVKKKNLIFFYLISKVY